MSKRIVSIRPKVYRGRSGFSVIGYARREPSDKWDDWWHCSVWTETRTSAEKIRARIRAGENTHPEDWTP